MKDLKIEIPSGYVVDEKNSNLLQGIIKFKQVEIRTFYDLVESGRKINGYYVNAFSEVFYWDYRASGMCENVFIDKKHAKSALAMAQISQLIPYYGGAITDKEWSSSMCKYTIQRVCNEIGVVMEYSTYQCLAFRTNEQAKDFLKYNKRLVKDYLMID